MSATVFTFSAPMLGIYSVSEVQYLWYATDVDPPSCTECVMVGRFYKEGPYKMFIFTIFGWCAVLCQFSYFQSWS